jgi:predicted PurR-regulated permease PerM
MRDTLGLVWQNTWVRALVILVLVAGVFWALAWVFKGAQTAINTVAIAVVFSYVCSPLIRWFEQRKLGRGLGVVAVFVGLFLFFGLATVMLLSMTTQLSKFLTDLPKQLEPIIGWAQALPTEIGRVEVPQVLRDALAQASLNLETLLQAFVQTLLRGLQTLLGQGGSLVGFVSGLLGGVFQLLTALTISIYLLYDLPKIGASMFEAVPKPYQPIVGEVATKADKAFGGFVRGMVLVSLANALVVTVAMYIAFGWFQGFGADTFTSAMSLGFLAFVFGFIPVVGVLISAVPAILLALPLGLPGLAAVSVALWLCNQVSGFVGPVIMRYTISIHPATGIAAALIGGSLFGFVGALLSGPFLALAKVVYNDYYLKSRFYEEG